MRTIDDEPDEPDEPDGPTPTRRSSGVREIARITDHRILVVDPDPRRRARLLDEARAMEADVRVAASVREAIAVRSTEQLAFLACYFPLAGAAGLIEELYAERFPAAVITNQVERAIAMFGLEMPLLRNPSSLAEILTQADELVRFASPAPLAKRARREYGSAAEEIVLAPRRRDPRRD